MTVMLSFDPRVKASVTSLRRNLAYKGRGCTLPRPGPLAEQRSRAPLAVDDCCAGLGAIRLAFAASPATCLCAGL